LDSNKRALLDDIKGLDGILKGDHFLVRRN